VIGEFLKALRPDTRDLGAEVEALLAERGWLTASEIANPKEKGGIGANRDSVLDELEAEPERFISRTGEAAKEVGRHPSATVWNLAQASEQPEQPSLSQGASLGKVAPCSGSKSKVHPEQATRSQPELAQSPEQPTQQERA
jgi:hypothetical protein